MPFPFKQSCRKSHGYRWVQSLTLVSPLCSFCTYAKALLGTNGSGSRRQEVLLQRNCQISVLSILLLQLQEQKKITQQHDSQAH